MQIHKTTFKQGSLETCQFLFRLGKEIKLVKVKTACNNTEASTKTVMVFKVTRQFA